MSNIVLLNQSRNALIFFSLQYNDTLCEYCSKYDCVLESRKYSEYFFIEILLSIYYIDKTVLRNRDGGGENSSKTNCLHAY